MPNSLVFSAALIFISAAPNTILFQQNLKMTLSKGGCTYNQNKI